MTHCRTGNWTYNCLGEMTRNLGQERISSSSSSAGSFLTAVCVYLVSLVGGRPYIAKTTTTATTKTTTTTTTTTMDILPDWPFASTLSLAFVLLQFTISDVISLLLFIFRTVSLSLLFFLRLFILSIFFSIIFFFFSFFFQSLHLLLISTPYWILDRSDSFANGPSSLRIVLSALDAGIVIV